MANLDTRQKRSSALGMVLSSPREQYNDATKAQAWRQNAAYSYTGILVSTVTNNAAPAYYFQLLVS